MVIRWPGNISVNIPNNSYIQNESSKEGRYPIGNNGLWHSGIHVRGQKIYSIMEGQLVAYYLSSKDTEIERKEISVAEYMFLPEKEKSLYEKAETKYEPKDGHQFETYTKNFFLIKHRAILPVTKDNEPPNSIVFFVLYTNIAAPEKRDNRFQPLDSFKDNWEIPFYDKYVFQVNNNSCVSTHKYITSGTKKVYVGQKCKLKYENAEKYKCKFQTENGEVEIPLLNNYIEMTEKPKYVPKNTSIQLYNIDIPQDGKPVKCKEGTVIKESAYFQGTFLFFKVSLIDFVKVRVYKDEIDTDEFNDKGDNPNYIIKFEDLKLKEDGKGLLKENVPNAVDEKGIPFYAGNNKESAVLGVMKPGEIIEFEKHTDFWRSYKVGSEQFIALKKENLHDNNKYLRFTKRINNTEQDLKVKITRKDNYKNIEDKTIICNTTSEKEMLDYNSLLGKPNYYISPDFSYYDLVLLLSNSDFLDHESLVEYKIPKGTKIYKEIKRGDHYSYEEYTETKEEIKVIKYETKEIYIGFYYQGELLYVPEDAIKDNETKRIDWKNDFDIFGNLNSTSASRQYPEIPPNGLPKDHVLHRKIICRHALEWDEDLYFDGNAIRPYCYRRFGVRNSENSRNEFKKQIEAIDIWKELKDATKEKPIKDLDTKENNFCFAHPVYFIEKLNNFGLLDVEINPYKNATMNGVKVVSNPGFAPVSDIDTEYYHDTAEGRIHYATISSHFNIPRRGRRHAGVDFSAKRGQNNNTTGHSPIHSFIYGTVVHTEDMMNRLYGVYIIIQSRDNPRHHFLLGHLKEGEHKRIKEGDQVTPGMTVTYASNTGECWSGDEVIKRGTQAYNQGRGTHLHLQFLIADKDKIFDETTGILHNLDSITWNPFNYDDIY